MASGPPTCLRLPGGLRGGGKTVVVELAHQWANAWCLSGPMKQWLDTPVDTGLFRALTLSQEKRVRSNGEHPGTNLEFQSPWPRWVILKQERDPSGCMGLVCGVWGQGNDFSPSLLNLTYIQWGRFIKTSLKCINIFCVLIND